MLDIHYYGKKIVHLLSGWEVQLGQRQTITDPSYYRCFQENGGIKLHQMKKLKDPEPDSIPDSIETSAISPWTS